MVNLWLAGPVTTAGVVDVFDVTHWRVLVVDLDVLMEDL
jgi:hypothetical protein